MNVFDNSIGAPSITIGDEMQRYLGMILQKLLIELNKLKYNKFGKSNGNCDALIDRDIVKTNKI